MARISRLLGTSDITAKLCFLASWTDAPEPKLTHATKGACSCQSGALCILRWSLASQQAVRDGLCLTHPFADFPGRLSLLRAALWRFSCRALLYCGLTGLYQLTLHHWHPLYSNQRAKLTMLCFQPFT